VPRQVDHDVRRREIARALWRVAARRGLHGVSFREVAAEAGVSVNLVQHYFGSRRDLLAWSVNHNTAVLGATVAARVEALGPDRTPRDGLRVMLRSFLPLDDETRLAMTVYHAFAPAAVSDRALMTPEVETGGRLFVDAIAGVLRQVDPPPGPELAVEALSLAAMILGLSLSVLLEQVSGDEALAVVDHHVDRLCR
jgi:AcrR family transcriptional regulator